jgi:hypothetical protein
MKKIFDIKKMGALALGLVAFAPAASAQDEVETTIAADVVNQYYWRGQDLGNVSLQPTLGIGYKGFSLPGWWMGAPWTMKKYIDDVFTIGHGSLYASDGRSRSDASKKYGSGGLIQGKKYMLSLTWNAPMEAFTDPDQFFHGVGVDGVYLPFHKANQFLGMESLPTFIVNDVIKAPNVPSYLEAYKAHLDQLFATAH